MVNWKYILAGIIMIGIAFFLLFIPLGEKIFLSIAGNSLNSFFGVGLLVYLVGFIGFITIIIGIFKN